MGNSLAEIAAEKAGIIKPGCVVVTSPQLGEADRVIENACTSCGAALVRVGSDVTAQGISFDMNRQLLRIEGRLGSYELSIPLLGRHQIDNAATAVAALEVLAEKGFDISKDSIAGGLAGVNWAGRLQILRRRPFILVDGAHNPDGARRLRESIQQYFDFDRAILIIGTSDDKDIAGIASALAPLFDIVIVTSSRHPRAVVPAAIAAEFARHGVETQVMGNVPEALSQAVTMAGDKDLICVAGSLFVIAEAIEQAKMLYSA